MDHSVRQMPDLPAWLAGVMSPEAWSIVFFGSAINCYFLGGGDFCCVDDSL